MPFKGPPEQGRFLNDGRLLAGRGQIGRGPRLQEGLPLPAANSKCLPLCIAALNLMS